MITQECVMNRCNLDGWKGHRGNCKIAIKQRIKILKSLLHNYLYYNSEEIYEMLKFEKNKLVGDKLKWQ